MRSIQLPLITCVTAFTLVSTPMIGVADPPAAWLDETNILRFEEFRSVDGTGNNVAHPEWGSANTPLLRLLAPPCYADNIEQPPSTGLPGPREVSNAVVAAPGPRPNARGASNFLWQWGQFIDHDISRTFPGHPDEPMPIPVPQGDPWFDPTGTGAEEILLSRSLYTMVSGVRQQINEITAFIDASQVYGSDPARATELRRLDGTGFLKTSHGGFLPYNENGFRNEPDASDPSFFLAGDIRVNEQLGLIAMHTLFVREHNHQAQQLRRMRPQWNGDRIYATARAIVNAEIQVITYREFLPLLLGADALPPYEGYKPDVNAGIDNAFSTAAYRVGHTLLTSQLLRLKHNGEPIPRGNIALRDAFFVPDELLAGQGIEPLLRGLAQNQAQEVDPFVVDEVRNFLFGPPGSGGFDLASLNIQRGRDHGLPRYNDMRVQLGLAPKMSFADVSSDPDVQARLTLVYDNVNEIDLWVGGLAEDHEPGAMVGELLRTVLINQFTRLRDGDRFWYENYLADFMIQKLERTTLAQIIRRNTFIGWEIPDNVFEIDERLALLVPDDPATEQPSDLGESAGQIPDEAPATQSPILVRDITPNPARTHAIVQVSPLTVRSVVSSEPRQDVRVAVYDVRGRLVRTLHRGALVANGGRWVWDLLSARGSRVPNGVYFVRVETAGTQVTRKLLLVD